MNTRSDTSEARLPLVLIVDDKPNNLRILNETLAGKGFELRAATSGASALQIAERVSPDLVLLDVVMPEMDGYEVCRRIKANPSTKEITVIFLSALDDPHDKVKGLTLGAVDFISKPFQPDEVLARVDTHLTIHRLQRQLARRNQELETAQQKMKEDLEGAAKIQQSMLPWESPDLGYVKTAWTYRPCDELAGDSLNIIQLDDHRAALFLFDVAGHGVQASLRSVSVSHSLMPRNDGSSLLFPRVSGAEPDYLASPASVAERLNTYFEVRDDSDRHFTLIYGVLNASDESFTYVAAGHPGPIHARNGEFVDVRDSTGVPIGIVPGMAFEEDRIECTTGDRILLYSDGLFEERNGEEQFGFDRITSLVRGGWGKRPPQLLQDLENALLDWSTSGSLTDDLSMLAVDWV